MYVVNNDISKRIEGEQVDCLNGRAFLGDLPYRLHLAVRYGEACRDLALALAGYNGYEDRFVSLMKHKAGLELEIMGWLEDKYDSQAEFDYYNDNEKKLGEEYVRKLLRNLKNEVEVRNPGEEWGDE